LPGNEDDCREDNRQDCIFLVLHGLRFSAGPRGLPD
jgi:hypothetical protein